MSLAWIASESPATRTEPIGYVRNARYPGTMVSKIIVTTSAEVE
jgi:hypothetical protein